MDSKSTASQSQNKIAPSHIRRTAKSARASSNKMMRPSSDKMMRPSVDKGA